jgi:NTP pyrophosphatase (non-canonical NTP hydrolase)
MPYGTKETFKQAFDNRSPQQIVADATKERGYRDGFTDEQFLARQILKMQEELGELVDHVNKFEDDSIAWDVLELGEKSRGSFDRIEEWQKAFTCLAATAKGNPDLLREEMTDMMVVLFNMATVIEEITEEPFDVVQSAVDKSRSDVKRGVR